MGMRLVEPDGGMEKWKDVVRWGEIGGEYGMEYESWKKMRWGDQMLDFHDVGGKQTVGQQVEWQSGISHHQEHG